MTTMTTQPPKTALRIKSALKAGGVKLDNHNKTALRIKSALKAGGVTLNNHNKTALRGR